MDGFRVRWLPFTESGIFSRLFTSARDGAVLSIILMITALSGLNRLQEFAAVQCQAL